MYILAPGLGSELQASGGIVMICYCLNKNVDLATIQTCRRLFVLLVEHRPPNKRQKIPYSRLSVFLVRSVI